MSLSAALQEGTFQACAFISAQEVDKMPTNVKDTKGLGKTLFGQSVFSPSCLARSSFWTIVVGAIGSIFTSTKPLFQFRLVKKGEDKSHEQGV